MRVLARVLALLTILAPVAPAWAANGSTGGTAVVDGDGQGQIAASATFAGVQRGRGPGKGGADSSGCHWTNNSSQLIDPAFFDTVKIVAGMSYKPFLKECPGVLPVLVFIPQVTPRALAQAAEAYAVERLPKPTTNAAPPLDKGIVKLGMWFWTEPNQYRPISASAWVPTPQGSLTATVTATPSMLMFDSGEPDGERVSCAGPGEQWLPEYGDELASDCMYTYQHSSAIDHNGTFAAGLSIVWNVTWVANGVAGTFDDYTTTSTQQITVNEIQAVITH